MIENPVRQKISRHIDIHRFFVRELDEDNIIKLIPIRTHKMVADALPKSLPLPAFISHRKVMLGQVPFSLNFWGTQRTSLSTLPIYRFRFIHMYSS